MDLGGHDLERISRSAAVVVAPGVPPDVPPLQTARAAGLDIHAEVDVGFLALRGTRCIGITGTNGKTTTTSLICARAGERGPAGGGRRKYRETVVRSRTANHPPDWLALELSSFQLHDAPHLKPDIGVLTNLAPNHLDRYATLDEYYGDKALLFRNADASSFWVTNADDAAVETMTHGSPGPGYGSRSGSAPRPGTIVVSSS